MSESVVALFCQIRIILSRNPIMSANISQISFPCPYRLFQATRSSTVSGQIWSPKRECHERYTSLLNYSSPHSYSKLGCLNKSQRKRLFPDSQVTVRDCKARRKGADLPLINIIKRNESNCLGWPERILSYSSTCALVYIKSWRIPLHVLLLYLTRLYAPARADQQIIRCCRSAWKRMLLTSTPPLVLN